MTAVARVFGPRRRTALAAAVASAALSAGTAFAAGLGVTAASLTSVSTPATVPSSTCWVTASADTYASSLGFLSNFGTATTLQVRSGLENKRTFVRFDLSECAIAAGAEIKAARLQLHLSAAPTSSRTYAVHRLTATWAEGTLNWNNQPGVAASATATTTTGTTAGVTLEWTVTTDVDAFVNGTTTNFGWRVADTAEGSLSALEGAFRSREGASPVPTLEVTYYP